MVREVEEEEKKEGGGGGGSSSGWCLVIEVKVWKYLNGESIFSNVVIVIRLYIGNFGEINYNNKEKLGCCVWEIECDVDCGDEGVDWGLGSLVVKE